MTNNIEYIYIYIYIYMIVFIYTCLNVITPGPPTKNFPAKSPRVKLSWRLPIKFNGHENSHPLEFPPWRRTRCNTV